MISILTETPIYFSREIQYLLEALENNTQDNKIIEKLADKFDSNKVKEVQNKVKQIENKLVQNNVDVEQIKEVIRKHVGTIPKDSSETNSYTLVTTFKNILLEMKSLDIFRQVAVGTALLIVVLIINTYLGNVLVLILGIPSDLAKVILATIVAPLTEETGKYLSVKARATGAHFIIFNIAEFLNYYTKYTSLGASPLYVILHRIPPVLMHLWNTLLHKAGHDTGKSADKYKKAVKVHAIWNFTASLSTLLKYI